MHILKKSKLPSKKYLQKIDQKNNIGLVVELNGRTVGMCFGHKKDDMLLLTQIYVHPDYVGQNIGSDLLKTFIERVGSLQIKVSVYDKNTHAINFYIKNGFIMTDEKTNYIMNDEVVLPEVVLIR